MSVIDDFCAFYSAFAGISEHIALTAIPSSLPMNPTFSEVVQVIPILSSEMPRTLATVFFIEGTNGLSLGFSAIMTAERL